tara:strand:- start:601 stop:1227 length:627 start_codon:yes stop_codon:yes gene_type:complete
MAARLPTIVASNYGCETSLSKSSDSTAGFQNNPPTDDTSTLNAAPYLINAGSDTLAVVPASVDFPQPIRVPWPSAYASTGTQPVTLTLNTPISLLPYIPADFNYSCIIWVDPVGAGNAPYSISSVGSIDNTGSNDIVQGFGTSVIAGVASQTGIGIEPTAGVTYSLIQTNNAGTDVTVGYFGTAGSPVPATMTVNITVQALASSVLNF